MIDSGCPNISFLYTIGTSIIGVLISVIIALWIKLGKKELELKELNKESRIDSKEDLKIITDLTNYLKSFGIEVNKDISKIEVMLGELNPNILLIKQHLHDLIQKLNKDG